MKDGLGAASNGDDDDGVRVSLDECGATLLRESIRC